MVLKWSFALGFVLWWKQGISIPGQYYMRLAEIELSLEVLWQENDEAGDDDELHAGAHAGHHVDLVGEEVPRGAGDVLDVLPVVVVL